MKSNNGHAARLSRGGIVLFSLVAVAVLAAPAHAQPASIGIARNADVAFGQVIAGGGAGSVTVTPAGARSASGGVTLGSSLSVSAASFTVTGEPLSVYAIVLPPSATLSSGGSSMTVDTFTSTPSDTGTIGAGGSQALSVGATLRVSAQQARGSYTGTFEVTVAYN